MPMPRPIPAVALRGQIPHRYLRILHDWAAEIADYQASIGNHPTADKAAWMRAVLNPDWQDGRCEGLTSKEVGSWRVMWATCGRCDAHEGHDQPQDPDSDGDLPTEQFEEIRTAIQQSVAEEVRP